MIFRNLQAKRAARGAVRLDEVRPGWASLADPRRLKVDDYTFCPLGQVYGHYRMSPRALRRHAVRDGFFPFDLSGNCRQLDKAWQAEIRRRTAE